MRKAFRRVLSLILLVFIVSTSVPMAVYGENMDKQSSMGDPFALMVDTTPELMTVRDMINFATSKGVSQEVIDTADVSLMSSDYQQVENLQQIVEETIEKLKDEHGLEIDPLLLNSVLEQQKKLVERSKTDRFLVKYKAGKENHFKKQVSGEILDIVEIENTIPNGFKRNNKNDSQKSLLESAEEYFSEVSDSIDFFCVDENKVELILLEECVNPSEFAEILRGLNLENDIEYIQPDFQMKLNSLKSSHEALPLNEEITITVVEETKDDEDTTGGAVVPDKIVTDDTDTKEEILTKNTIVPEEAVEVILLEALGGKKVLVAVIDTGLDITHPDLKEQIYTNPGEISGNGIDDDGNGYVDDVNGWNFPENTEIVYQESLGLEQAHATHIAGIITGSSNADKALTSNENIEIMPLRVFNNGTAYTSDIIAAIEYAEKMGAKIVNCSFGSTENNPALKEAMEKSSMLFICAAGNARTDLEVKPIYPACFGLDNTISVTSENADGGLSYFSNYSPEFADVAALGRDVYSTLPDGEYGLQNGTSISAALVSGIAAAVLSTDDALGSPELKARLLETSDKLSNLQETVAEGRRINASDAILNVVKADIVQTSPENDFEVKGYAPTQSELYQLYSSGSIVQVAAGDDFSLALKNDGTVWSWGGNYVGQCGNGSDDRSVTFTRVIGLTNVINIAAGSKHGLAVKSDGTVWMWGYDWYGVNGGGSIPVQVIGLTGVRSVCGGIVSA